MATGMSAGLLNSQRPCSLDFEHAIIRHHMRSARSAVTGQATRRLGRQGQSISARTVANAVAAVWRSSRLCAADTCVLIRALPAGTTG